MAASTTLTIYLIFILLALIPTQCQSQSRPRLDRVNRVLRESGFGYMAEMLEEMYSDLFLDLEILESKNKTYTVFAPDDLSFSANSNYDPTLSLIRYHIVPFRVDMDLLASPSMAEQKIDTLLQGHPLVVTTGLAESWTSLPSINLVPIGRWNVYNDGNLIVHGLFRVFSEVYQHSRYPEFDGPEAPVVSPVVVQGWFTSRGSSDSGHKNPGFFSLLFCFVVYFLLLQF